MKYYKYLLLCALFAVSCSNLFHEIPVLVDESVIPEISYIYPGNGEVDVPTNSSIIVSFNTQIDASTISKDSFVVKDYRGDVVEGSFEIYSEKVVLFIPTLNLEMGKAHSLTIRDSIKGANGIQVKSGVSVSFTVGEEKDVDPPIKVNSSPVDNGIFTSGAMSVTFNEDLNPFSVTNTSVILTDGVAHLLVDVEYDANSRSIIIRPMGSLVDNSLYSLTVVSGSSGISDLAGIHLASDVVVPFRTGAVKTYLEEPYNLEYGFGTFGYDGPDKGVILRTKDGAILRDVVPYEQSLADVFDPGTSGAFADGKYVRIVENGKNITDPAGLNLVPIAKSFAGGVVSPPRNQCYIDPVSGQFVLPRPVYWSKCTDMDDITKTPEIVSRYSPSTSTSGSIVTESFIVDGPFSNNVWYRYNRAYSDNQATPQTLDDTRIVYPSGEHALNWSRGTVSLWIKSNSTIDGSFQASMMGTAQSDVVIGEESKIAVRLYDYYMRNGGGQSSSCQYILYLGGTSIGYVNVTRNVWHHVYMVWDSGCSLDGGTKTIRLFIDGVEQINSMAMLPDLTSWVLGMTMRSYAYAIGLHYIGPYWGVDTKVYEYVENIKIWDHVVSEDPSWLYNGGVGNENALHVIYGSINNYQPKLTGTGNGVGYYYVPQ